MKKLLSLLIITSLILLSAFSGLTLAADDDSYEPVKEMTILSQLGLVKELPENMDSTITRGQFTQILISMMNAESLDASGCIITDINEFHDYFPTMSRAIKLGLVNGPVTRPDDAVKANEAIKMIICMTGYNQYALHKGGWSVGYQTVARDIGLLDGISAIGDVTLSWNKALVFLYNAICVDVLEPEYIRDDNINYNSTEGRTILTQFHGIVAGEGIVESVNGKSLENYGSLKSNEVIIGSKRFKTAFEETRDYVGYNVEYLYNEDTNALCAIYPQNNEVKKISAESVIDIESGKLIYEEKKSESERADEKEIDFSPNTVIMYNDVVIDTYDSNYFLDKQGEFTFIDNDTDGICDVILLEITEDYVVKIADNYTQTIYDIYDSSKSICLSDKNGQDISFVDRYGNPMLLSELLRYDVISVKKSYDGNKITAVFSNLEARGTVEAIDITNGRKYLTIRGKKYETTSDFNKYENVKTGEWGVFGITTTGKIACVNRSFSAEGAFCGYLIKAKASSGLDTVYSFRILSQNGEVVILNAADKVVVDAVTMKAEEAFTYLGGNNTKSQPIIYEVNKNGYISNIDTMIYNEGIENRNTLREMYNCYNVSYDEDGNTIETKRTELEWRNTIFGSKIVTSGNTVFFKVSSSKDAPDEEFGVALPSTIPQQKYYSFKAYKKVEDSPIADIIILPNDDVGEDTGSNHYIISEISEALDNDGNVATKIDVYLGRNKQSYFVKDKSVLANAKWFEADQTLAGLNHNFVAGDIIKIVADSDGFIKNIELIYDRVENQFYTPLYYNTPGANALVRISFNEVYQNYSGTLVVHKGPIPEGTEELGYDQLESYNASNFTVLICDPDEKDEIIKLGTVSDLSDFKTTGKGSMIFLQTAYTTNGTIVVYRNLQ